MSSPSTASAGWAQSIRILAYALTTSPIVIALVLAFVLKPADGEDPTVAPIAIVIEVALGIAAALLIGTVGYRLAPLPSATSTADAYPLVAARYQQAMILRFALAEAPLLVAVALSFVFSPLTFLNFIAGAVISLALMVWHVWPNDRVLQRCAAALEANGTPSGLAALFGR